MIVVERGRGAWSVSGAGGTLKVDGKSPGPYYCLAAAGVRKVGDTQLPSTINSRAVRAGVVAIQRALNRRQIKAPVSGVFDQNTKGAVVAFQLKYMPGESSWGGVGPETAKALFLHDVKVRSTAVGFEDWRAVCGIISSESSFDPGAVGYLDPDDLGLAQINGRSHPDMTEQQRLQPIPSIGFVATYLKNAMDTFGGNERDAIASYNLGAGGTRTWIRAGRPTPWVPAGSTTPRDVNAYIDKILSACA
jgi:hypothetical protein